MSIELNRFMTTGERHKAESVLKRAAGRDKINTNGLHSDKVYDCGLDEYMTRDEKGRVDAIMQKAVDRIPGPRKGGVGEHYLIRMCRCSKYLEAKARKRNPEIKCSRYLGSGYCSGRRYSYEDDLPFV